MFRYVYESSAKDNNENGDSTAYKLLLLKLIWVETRAYNEHFKKLNITKSRGN